MSSYALAFRSCSISTMSLACPTDLFCRDCAICHWSGRCNIATWAVPQRSNLLEILVGPGEVIRTNVFNEFGWQTSLHDSFDP